MRTVTIPEMKPHTAALAMEHQAIIHSNDADFGRFPCTLRTPL